MTSHETYDSKANPVLTTFRYPQDITLSGSIYDKMENKGMTGIPIEILEYRNGKLCSGRLTTYAEKSGIIVPQKTFRLGLTEPIDASTFSPYNGSTEDKHYLPEYEILDTDKYGNPIAVREEDGVITTYLWDYPGRYPVMKARNAHNSYNSVTVYENVWKNKYITLSASKPSQNVQKYTIRTYREGSVQINLPGMRYHIKKMQANRRTDLFRIVLTPDEFAQKIGRLFNEPVQCVIRNTDNAALLSVVN